MGFAKNEKGIEVDAQGNVVAEKYDKHLLPGDEGYGAHVPVVVDENSAHEKLKAVAAENPGLEVEDGGNYIVVTPERARETGATGPVSPVAAPGSSADPASGRQGGTEAMGLYADVAEQDAKNKEASAQAAEAVAADADEGDEAADEAAERARAEAEAAKQRAGQSDSE
jgi:hypothetical protein